MTWPMNSVPGEQDPGNWGREKNLRREYTNPRAGGGAASNLHQCCIAREMYVPLDISNL